MMPHEEELWIQTCYRTTDYADDGFQDWLNGNRHVVHGDAYIGDLTKRLMKVYRERITDTHTCSSCGKQASEKYSWGHPDKLIKQGYADPDIYPDGKIPMDPDFDRDSIQWKHKIICDECWEKEHGRHRRRVL